MISNILNLMHKSSKSFHFKWIIRVTENELADSMTKKAVQDKYVSTFFLPLPIYKEKLNNDWYQRAGNKGIVRYTHVSIPNCFY